MVFSQAVLTEFASWVDIKPLSCHAFSMSWDFCLRMSLSCFEDSVSGRDSILVSLLNSSAEGGGTSTFSV